MVYGYTARDIVEEDFQDISAEQIEAVNEFFEQHKELFSSYLNESQIELINEAAANNDKALVKMVGSGNASKINNAAKQCGEIIKKEGINKTTREKINNIINTTFDSLSNVVISPDDIKDYEKFGRDKIIASLKLLLTVIVLNTLSTIVLTIAFEVPGALAANHVVCPIIEELAKEMAERKGIRDEYFALFNEYEFVHYVTKFGPLYGFFKISILRLATVTMHAAATLVHKAFNDPKILKFLKLDPEKDKGIASIIGTTAASIIHIFWNSNGDAIGTVILKFIQ